MRQPGHLRFPFRDGTAALVHRTRQLLSRGGGGEHGREGEGRTRHQTAHGCSPRQAIHIQRRLPAGNRAARPGRLRANWPAGFVRASTVSLPDDQDKISVGRFPQNSGHGSPLRGGVAGHGGRHVSGPVADHRDRDHERSRYRPAGEDALPIGRTSKRHRRDLHARRSHRQLRPRRIPVDGS